MLEGSDGVPKIVVDLQEHVEPGRRQRFQSVTGRVEQLQMGRLVGPIAQTFIDRLVPFLARVPAEQGEELLECSQAGAGDVGNFGQIDQKIPRAGRDRVATLLPKLLELLRERGFELVTLAEARSRPADVLRAAGAAEAGAAPPDQPRPEGYVAPSAPPSDDLFARLSALCR